MSASKSHSLLYCLSAGALLLSLHAQAADTATDAKGKPPVKGVVKGQAGDTEVKVSSLYRSYSDEIREALRNGTQKPVVGRTQEVNEIDRGIQEDGKVVLKGDPKSGRSMAVVKLAIENPALQIYRLDSEEISKIPREQQGKWISEVIKELETHARNFPKGSVALFIENFDQYVGHEQDTSSPHQAITKEIIFGRKLSMIIEASTEAYADAFLAKPMLDKLVTKVHVDPPKFDILVQELRGQKAALESLHGVSIPDATLIRLATIFADTPALGPVRSAGQALSAAIKMAKTESQYGFTDAHKLKAERVPLIAEYDSVSADYRNEAGGPEKEALKQQMEKLKLRIDEIDVKLQGALPGSADTRSNIESLKQDVADLKDQAKDVPAANEPGGGGRMAQFWRGLFQWKQNVREIELLDAMDSISGTEGDQRAPVKAKVGPRHVELAASQILNVPPDMLSVDVDANIHKISLVNNEIFNQQDAVKQIELALTGYKQERTELAIEAAEEGREAPHRPIGSFLLAGDSGIGKTELVKAVARTLGVPESAILRIDFSDYSEPHTVSRLIGSPPGYEGNKEGGILTEGVRSRGFTVFLGDEFGRENRKVSQIWMQINDDGRLNDSRGTTVHFDNVIQFFTTNDGREAGSMSQEQLLEFFKEPGNMIAGDDYSKMSLQDLRISYVKKALMNKGYDPAFINRFTIIVMNSHNSESVARLAHKVLRRWVTRTARFQKMNLVVSEAAIAHLIEAFRQNGGARTVIAAHQKEFRDLLKGQIREHGFKEGDSILVDFEDGAMKFNKVPAEQVVAAKSAPGGRQLPNVQVAKKVLTEQSVGYDPKASLKIFTDLFTDDFMVREAVAKVLRRFRI